MAQQHHDQPQRGSRAAECAQQSATLLRHAPSRRPPRRQAAVFDPDAGAGRNRGPEPPPAAGRGKVDLQPPQLVPLTPSQEEAALALLGELIVAAASQPAPDRLTFRPANGLIRFPPIGSDPAPSRQE
jgi:hypothetical protein